MNETPPSEKARKFRKKVLLGYDKKDNKAGDEILPIADVAANDNDSEVVSDPDDNFDYKPKQA